MFHPFSAKKTDAKENAPADPIDTHSQPDAGKSHIHLLHKIVRQHHTKDPHAQNADAHRILGVSPTPQHLRQCKTKRPEKNTENTKQPDNFDTHLLCCFCQMISFGYERNADIYSNIHDCQANGCHC